MEDADKWNEARLQLFRMMQDLQTKLIELDPKIKSRSLEPEEQADVGWALREITRISDEIRKACVARMDLLGKMFASDRIRIASESMDDALLTVRGRFASATADCRMQAVTPKAGTPEYQDFCRFLGIPDETVDSGVVQFHYSRMADWLTRRMADGLPSPSGLTKTYPIYSTTYRTLRGSKKSNGPTQDS
jgi:hypothetical protein